ncbi:MAG: hypothetical protein OXB88_04095, partial [Bacteriovoracales bacterium]|nr:hypothetical protein [Bacteriovoracales bacterium]
VTARTSSKNCNKGKVTVLHPDKIGRRQRGATEACFLHVAGKRRGSRLPRLPGGEQLPNKNLSPPDPSQGDNRTDFRQVMRFVGIFFPSPWKRRKNPLKLLA